MPPSPSLPPTMRALVAESKGVAKVAEVPLPRLKPEENEILVRVKSVALNPTDWKHLHFMSPTGAILGCDFSGEVAVAISQGSEDTNGLNVGDRIAGFVHGSKYVGEDARGAFAEYVKTSSTLVWKVPDSVSFDEAAAIGGIASETAVHALYLRHKLPPPPGTQTAKEPGWFLVWAGATSVGQYAIQFAHASGLKVVTTASPQNHEHLRKLGADEVFDYRDPETPNKIRSLTSNSIEFALDCISENGTLESVHDSVSDRGATVVMLRPETEFTKKSSAEEGIVYERIAVYTTRGKAFDLQGDHFPANPSDREGIEKWLKDHYPRLTSSGQLKANPIRLWEGGLSHVQEGLDFLREGKNRAQKLVYRI